MGGPASLTGYRILYKESASSTWLTSDQFGDDSTTTATIEDLSPNTEYNFLVAATNTVTDARNATYTTIASHTGTNSAQLDVTTNGDSKLWDGSAFSPAIANLWNGSAFVSGTTKIWDGSEWVRAGS
jgi:hypothetical protein